MRIAKIGCKITTLFRHIQLFWTKNATNFCKNVTKIDFWVIAQQKSAPEEHFLTVYPFNDLTYSYA